MKKTLFASTFVLLFLLLYGIASIPVAKDEALELESALLHQFIEYEENFGNLNSFNASNQLSYAVNIFPPTRDNLILRLLHSSHALNAILETVEMEHPYAKKLVANILHWKAIHEQAISNKEHLLYWQVNLLKLQLQLVYLINEKSAEKNSEALSMVKEYENSLKGKSIEKLCEMVNQFSLTNDPKEMAKQIAAVKLADGHCDVAPLSVAGNARPSKKEEPK